MTTPDPGQETPPDAPLPARRRNRRLLRYFFLQLVPVTAGILIALAIDGLLELRRQDALVAEAHAAIAAEIADNARALDNALPSIDTFIDSVVEAQTAIAEILATGTTTHTEFNWNMIAPGLNRASWESAERTGALSYMEYEQVRQYARLYAMQDAMLASQAAAFSRFPTLGPVVEAVQSEDRATRQDDLRRGRATRAELAIVAGSHRFTAGALKSRYQRFPCYVAECPQAQAAPSP